MSRRSIERNTVRAMGNHIKIKIYLNDDGSVAKCKVEDPNHNELDPSDEMSGTPQCLLAMEYGFIVPQKPGSKKVTAKTRALDLRCKYVKVGNSWYKMCPSGVTC